MLGIILRQKLSSKRTSYRRHLRRTPLGNVTLPAILAALGPQIDHPIRIANHIQIMQPMITH